MSTDPPKITNAPGMDIMDVTGSYLANMSFSTVLTLPNFVQEFEASTGQAELPKWICDLYRFRTQTGTSGRRIHSQPLQSLTRPANSKRWIKRTNSSPLFEGIRERKLVIISRLERNSKKDLNAMSRPVNMVQYQRHAIHLMSSLLSIRTNASPFTLVLDDLNQRAMPFLQEMVHRGLSRNVNVIIVSFEGARFDSAVQNVKAWGNCTAADILNNIEQLMSNHKESLVIVDNMHDAVATKNINTAMLFDLVVMKFASTLVGVYHTDIHPEPSASSADAYAPQPLELLKFMATSIVTCRSLAHVLAAKAARERSLPEPTFGLLAGAEGVVQCLNANDRRGIVLEAEFRRKSGRPESETYFLRPGCASDYHAPVPPLVVGTLKQEFVILLDQHPAYANQTLIGLATAAGTDMETSFNLGLTDKQKAARENVVLPYFDAQKEGGGEGGRILYDMGEEDDFDEEEDEI